MVIQWSITDTYRWFEAAGIERSTKMKPLADWGVSPYSYPPAGAAQPYSYASGGSVYLHPGTLSFTGATLIHEN